MPRVLVIAGSDSGGGAGLQADVKTITMLGGHAMTAITAITAQNTLGVQAVMQVPTAMVLAQIDSVVSDIGVDAVKIGMVGSAATAEALAERLASLDVPIVFDPVMVASSGSRLADAATIAAFTRLVALASVTTPNLPELAALGGEANILSAGQALLVKGGHGEGQEVIDRLVEADGTETVWRGARIATRYNHGTGCTLASGIAEGLARGLALPVAVDRARRFVRLAMLEAPGLGGGHGPMGQGRVRLDGFNAGAALNQVTLPLDDMAASTAFYRLLGLKRIVASGDRYARFETAGGATLSVEARGEMPGTLVYLECGDLDRVLVRLREAGVAVDGPHDRPWGWREARLTDPAGNPLCLYWAGEARRFPSWRRDEEDRAPSEA